MQWMRMRICCRSVDRKWNPAHFIAAISEKRKLQVCWLMTLWEFVVMWLWEIDDCQRDDRLSYCELTQCGNASCFVNSLPSASAVCILHHLIPSVFRNAVFVSLNIWYKAIAFAVMKEQHYELQRYDLPPLRIWHTKRRRAAQRGERKMNSVHFQFFLSSYFHLAEFLRFKTEVGLAHSTGIWDRNEEKHARHDDGEEPVSELMCRLHGTEGATPDANTDKSERKKKVKKDLKEYLYIAQFRFNLCIFFCLLCLATASLSSW